MCSIHSEATWTLPLMMNWIVNPFLLLGFILWGCQRRANERGSSGNSCWDIVQNFCPKANCGGSRFWFNDAGRLRHMLWWMSCPRLEKLGSKIADSWIMTLPIPGGHNPANNHCSALIYFFPINRLVLQRRVLLHCSAEGQPSCFAVTFHFSRPLN